MATALLLGFREQTIDIDIKLAPEPAGVFEAIALLKIAWLKGKVITASDLRTTFAEVEPALVRFPAIDPAQFKKKVEDFLAKT